MTTYNYYEEMKKDIRNWIEDNEIPDEIKNDSDELYNYLYDRLWVEDSVTGNASGSYTFSAYQAEENLSHNWDLIEAAAEEFCCELTLGTGYEHGPEWWDVTIRCYLLAQVLGEIVEELETDHR